MSEPRRIWILRLIPNIRFGRLLTAITILLVLVGVYAAVGTFNGALPNRGTATAAVFFALLIAYVVPAFHYTVVRCEDAFVKLTPRLNATSPEIENWRRQLAKQSVRAQLIIVVVGLLAGLAHSIALTRPAGPMQLFADGRIQSAANFGTILVWVVMTTVVAGLFRIALIFGRLGRRIRVDLLQTRTLTPFALVAVILTLVIIGAQALFPILWLNNSQPLITAIPGLIVTTIPMLFLFATPLVPIHRTISAVKRMEIRRLDGELAALSDERQKRPGDLVPLASLLIYRREIEAVREWPFDTGVSSRLIFYLLIPPITWVGSAVIQHFVDSAL